MNRSSADLHDVSDLCLVEIDGLDGERLFSCIQIGYDENDVRCRVTPYRIPKPMGMQKSAPNPRALDKLEKTVIAHMFICEKYKACLIGNKPSTEDLIKLQNPNLAGSVTVPTFSLFDNILMITDIIFIEANKYVADNPNLDVKTLNRNVEEFIDFIATNYHSIEVDEFRNIALALPEDSKTSAPSNVNSGQSSRGSEIYFHKSEKAAVFNYCVKRLIEQLNKQGSYDPIGDFYPIFAFSSVESEVKHCINMVVKSLYDTVGFETFFKCVMGLYIEQPEECARVLELFRNAVVGTDFSDIFGPVKKPPPPPYLA